VRRVPGADGLALAVHEWPGGRPAVVCVHGLTANHSCWTSVAETLAPRHRVIAYDLRGRGDSDKPPRGYDLGAHARDLGAVLDAHGLASAVVMGHSLGAKIALRFAVDAPGRVQRLALWDGGIDLRPEVFESIAPAVTRLGTEFPSLDAFLERMRALPMLAGRWNAYLERYFRYDVETLPGGAVRAKAPRAAIEEELENLRRERLWVLHHQVRCPTLVLRAPDGLLTPTDCLITRDEARALVAALPRGRLVEVPGTNHYTLLMGQHARVRAALRGFLREGRRRRGAARPPHAPRSGGPARRAGRRPPARAVSRRRPPHPA
jgi:pimeloyl-ACP methyl ester carboxylesterase